MTEKVTRRGPKPKPESQRRSHVSLVSLTPAERKLLDRQRGQTPLATYLRKKALASNG